MENDIKLTKLSNCSGCAAKVGAGTLSKLLDGISANSDPNLLVGFDRSDDACVYRLDDTRSLVQTVDFFPPMVDDPYTFGQIAAANALSDIYAMGGEPKVALNLLCIPKDMPSSAVHAMLKGGLDKTTEAGAVIAGGHSIYDDVPKYGLCVTGFVDTGRILTNSGAHEGDVLILTKPIGVGILNTAVKAGFASDAQIGYAVNVMTTLNRTARDIMVKYRVHACTDVTGFGLMGHLYEMCAGADLTAEVELERVVFMNGAIDFARMGVLPEGMYRNRSYAEAAIEAKDIPVEYMDALFDPQTSGGLLMAVDPSDAETLFNEMRSAVPACQRIGRLTAAVEKRIIVR